VSSEKKNLSSSWPSFPEANLEAWKKSAQKSAPNGDVDKLGWRTPDGIQLKALYTSSDIQGLNYTLALCILASRGPKTNMEARMVFTISYVASELLITAALRTT
jgi:methylmalonyl-CoA mutase